MSNKSTMQERAKNYLKENETLLKKYKLRLQLVVNFPKRKKPTLLSKLALWIVAKQGGRLDLQFDEKKREER